MEHGIPDLSDPSVIDQLKRDECLVRFSITVEPDTAVEMLAALRSLKTPVAPEHVEIVNPTFGGG